MNFKRYLSIYYHVLIENQVFLQRLVLNILYQGRLFQDFFYSLIYGILGTLSLNLISLLLSFSISSNLNFILLIGILLVTITFLFKISAAPFHFWTPDVYEGSALSSTISFAILPKIALFTFLIKWFSTISRVGTLGTAEDTCRPLLAAPASC